jgi:hypothetical protein
MIGTMLAGWLRACRVISLGLAWTGAPAAELYVSTAGSDAHPGTAAEPLRTITQAYALADAGSVIWVLPGTYTDYTSGWGLRLDKRGTPDAPIILKSLVRGAAIIDGENAPDRNRAVYIEGEFHVLDGFDIRNGPEGGIAVYGNNNRIIHCRIHHNGTPDLPQPHGQDGIYSNHDTAGNVYAYNSIHDNGRPGSNLDHGMYLCGRDEMVMHNVLYRNAASGLQVAGYSLAGNLRVFNNVMAWNGTHGIILWMALDGITIHNNILFRNAGYALHSYDAHGGGVVIGYNLCHGNGAGDFNFTGGGSDYSYVLGRGFSGDPAFVDNSAAGFNPHLSAVSPAYAAGTNLHSLLLEDPEIAAGPAVGAWNLGAYLYGPANRPPLLSSPPNRATTAGNPVGPMTFTLSDAETPPGSLTAAVTSSNWDLISEDQLELARSGESWSLRLTSVPDVAGTAFITIRASDGQSVTSGTFSLSVRPRQAPPATPPALQMSVEDGILVIRWSASREAYVLQTRSITDTNGAWLDVGGVPVLDGAQLRVSIIAEERGGWYRLRREEPLPPAR